jgi:hypothetical protein
MNKQIKKKLELQLQSAMEGILLKQDSKAASKSRKAIRQASKAVAKKFNKALKSIEKKEDSEKQKKIKAKKKALAGKSQIKNITGETAKIRRSYTKEPAAPPVEAPETISNGGEGPGTGSL